MRKTIIALYDQMDDAQAVVEALVRAGADREEISILAGDPEGWQGQALERREESDSARAAGSMIGPAAGAVVGGVLGGLGGLFLSLKTFRRAPFIVGALLKVSGLRRVIVAGPIVAGLTGAGIGAVAGGSVGALVSPNRSEKKANYYDELEDQDSILVAVKAADHQMNQFMTIMNRHSPVMIKQRAVQGTGWPEGEQDGLRTNSLRTTFDAARETENRGEQPWPVETESVTNSSTKGETTMSKKNNKRTSKPEQEAKRTDEKHHEVEATTIPVIEEEFEVDKREEERGKVRVRTHMEEEPVEESVHLREERAHVERKPVNKPTSREALNDFEEEVFEVTETAEEPVTNKKAWIVEEVTVGKEVEEGDERIRDTVRRTEVDIDTEDFSSYQRDFYRHYNENYANTRRDYAAYEPAYYQGFNLATNEQYQDREWQEIEPEVQRQWKNQYQNTGPWEEFRDCACYAWNTVSGI